MQKLTAFQESSSNQLRHTMGKKCLCPSLPIPTRGTIGKGETNKKIAGISSFSVIVTVCMQPLCGMGFLSCFAFFLPSVQDLKSLMVKFQPGQLWGLGKRELWGEEEQEKACGVVNGPRGRGSAAAAWELSLTWMKH